LAIKYAGVAQANDWPRTRFDQMINDPSPSKFNKRDLWKSIKTRASFKNRYRPEGEPTDVAIAEDKKVAEV